MTSVKDCLVYLEEAGWTELIDSRWKDEVVKELQERFPDVSDEVINRVLEVTLWPKEEKEG